VRKGDDRRARAREARAARQAAGAAARQEEVRRLKAIKRREIEERCAAAPGPGAPLVLSTVESAAASLAGALQDRTALAALPLPPLAALVHLCPSIPERVMRLALCRLLATCLGTPHVARHALAMAQHRCVKTCRWQALHWHAGMTGSALALSGGRVAGWRRCRRRPARRRGTRRSRACSSRVTSMRPSTTAPWTPRLAMTTTRWLARAPLLAWDPAACNHECIRAAQVLKYLAWVHTFSGERTRADSCLLLLTRRPLVFMACQTQHCFGDQSRGWRLEPRSQKLIV